MQLSGSTTSGLINVKGYRLRASDLAVWNRILGAFETYNSANIDKYGIAATEQGATGIYSFTDPADTVAGTYRLIAAAASVMTEADVRLRTFWEDEAGPEVCSTSGSGSSPSTPGSV